MSNTISTNVMGTVSTNSDDEKVDCYILHASLLVIVLLFNNCYYLLSLYKT